MYNSVSLNNRQKYFTNILFKVGFCIILNKKVFLEKSMENYNVYKHTQEKC